MINLSVNERLIERLNRWSVEFNQLDYRGKRRKKDGEICYIKYSLLEFIIQAYYQTGRRHKSSKDDSYFSVHELRDKLGNEYHKTIRVCFDVSTEWSGGETKIYKIKDDVRKICNEIFIDDIQSTWIINKGGKRIKTFRSNAVNKWINREKKLKSKMGNALFSVNVDVNRDNILMGNKIYRSLYEYKFYNIAMSDNVKSLLNTLGIRYKGKGSLNHRQIEDRMKKVANLQYIIGLKHSPGNTVTQLYNEKMSGRLYNEGAMGLQTLPKDIRYLCMGGLGYYEYDIVNCHYELYRQLLRMYGRNSYYSINEYCDGPTEMRDKIANELQISTKPLKVLLLSIINGASKSLRNHKRLNKSGTNTYIVQNKIIKKFIDYCGNEKDGNALAKEFVNNKRVSALFDDCENSWDWLEKQLVYVGNKSKKNNRYKLMNPYGLGLPYYNVLKGKKANRKFKGQLVSHILQGCESMLLSFVIDKDGEDFIMPHHDGWISRVKIDKTEYEDMLHKESMKMLCDYDGIDDGFRVKIVSRKLDNLTQLKLNI
ncbi:hypothetical protein CL616_04205 [archaeon]|jgi:hypothetical protein|nr:hypothetical protein [archaeon]|tara:strand:+ start:177 stop:1793 length:1617 start_codon:yes stop_codon:yes gene_type:complete